MSKVYRISEWEECYGDCLFLSFFDLPVTEPPHVYYGSPLEEGFNQEACWTHFIRIDMQFICEQVHSMEGVG